MAHKHWLNMKPYGLNFFLARDLNGKGAHTLVMVGPGLANHRQELQSLGFQRDERFVHREYWTRSAAGLSPANIQRLFPQAQLELTAIDKIMPALRAGMTQRNAPQPISQENRTDGAEFRDARELPEHDVRGADDARARVPSNVGEDNARDDVRAESVNDEVAIRQERADALPLEAERVTSGQSPQSGEGLDEDEPTTEDGNVLRPPRMDESLEAGGPRDSNAGSKLESEGLTAAPSSPSAFVALEFLIDQSQQWFRVETSSSHSELQESIPTVLRRFIERYNINHASTNIESRIVDDLTGEVTFYEADSSLFLEPVQASQTSSLPNASNAELDSDEVTALQAKVRQLFEQDMPADAYFLFKQDPTANPLSLQEFIEEMHASAGGSEASLRLSRAQRTYLSRELSLTSSAIELFAQEGELRGFAKLQSLLAQGNVLAAATIEALVDHENQIETALLHAGWARDELYDQADPDRSAKWSRAGIQEIYREASQDGWVYVGAEKGSIKPLFDVVDSYELSPSHIAYQIKSHASAIWGASQNESISLEKPELDTNESASSTHNDAQRSGVIDAEQVEETPDRIWRGTTYDQVLKGQRTPFSDVSRVLKAFAAMSKAESSGLASLEESEKVDLTGFKGWGGVAPELRTDNRINRKNGFGVMVADHLSVEEGVFNQQLLENRLESYYTPAPLIRSNWKVFKQAGVASSGRFLEPGCGSGLFFSCAPEEVQSQARLVGVECDPFASRMARINAPDAVILEKRLEQTVLDKGFDGVIGNVPFGETLITDSRYPDAKHIHDYFIVRSLDHLKPGGIMSVITSSGTLDKKDDRIRQQIMARANLVAAFRLPVEIFSDQDASVTTDLLVLQRRPDHTAPDFDFTKSIPQSFFADKEEHKFFINQYFVDHPEHVLGNYDVASSAFGPKLQVITSDDLRGLPIYQKVDAIAALLDKKVEESIAPGIANRSKWPQSEFVQALSDLGRERDFDYASAVEIQDFKGLVGDYTLIDDSLFLVLDIVDQFDENGIRNGHHHLVEEIKLPPKKEAVLRAYLPLRDAARLLINAQINGTDDELAQAQGVAQRAYDEFVKAHGPVNKLYNVRIFEDDPGSTEVMSLELWDDELEEVTALADTFTARVVRSDAILNATNSEDAFYISIDRRGKVDLDFMTEISGIAREALINDLLGNLIFVDPHSHEYISSEVYLSGNVVKKLEEARQAFSLDERFKVNVEALKAAQPAPIPFEQITIRLGSNWIPANDIRGFVSSLVNQKLTEADFKVRYSAGAGIWTIDVSDSFKREHESARTALFGTQNASLEILLEKLLNSQRPSHYDKIDGKSVLNEVATMASRGKQDELNDAFYKWVASDPDRIERFTHLYNQATNVIRVPTPNGSRLTFPGLSPSWRPRDHQCDKVAMAMMGFNSMAAHPVGAGKTFEMVAIAIKLGQLGMYQKPMIAVPNHMLGQISREAKQMYPGARVLMVTGEDLRGANRKRFLAIARNNKWDLVVCTHSLLNQISAPLDIVLKQFDKQIDVINCKIAETENRRVERQLQASLKTVTGKREDTIRQFDEASKRSGMITIDRLGVDALLVDEAHLYKNLGLNSAMNVLGVTTSSSQRAFNLNALGEYLRDYHSKSFGMHFFTGTPVANTMCELYVHNKMLRPELLDEMGITHFDEWANRFGDIVSGLEALPEGGGFRVNERFARFVNLPEMIRLFRSFADVKSKEQLNLPVPKVHSHTVSVEQSDWQKAFMKHLAIRAVAVRKGRVRLDEDNMLSVATAGRKASLDMRLVEDILPEDSSLKLKSVAENLYRIWKESSEVKGTQLVFIDLGTPGKDKPFSCYAALKDLLVDMGMPGADIAFIHDAKTNDAKEKIFEKVRSGEIRILFGSTEKMGVGTNVQERLCALHHVDCPWRPSDIEQRKGRIERQGNKFFAEVEEYRYTTKDSFDLFMWETNKRKAAFISQALADPSIASREVSEEMDLGYAEVMAVTTGNPKIREKVELDDQVAKLDRKERAWYADRANKASLARSLQLDQSIHIQRLEVEQQVKEALPKCRFSHVTVTGPVKDLQDGDATWLYATPIGQAVLSRLPFIEAKLMRNNEVEAPLNMRVGDIELVVSLNPSKYAEIKGKLDGKLLPINIVQPSKNEQMTGKRLRDWFRADERILELTQAIEAAKKNLAVLGDIDLSSEWPHRTEHQELWSRKRELDHWFSQQNFDQQAEGPDPFLRMLEQFRESTKQLGQDAPEAVPAHPDNAAAQADESQGEGHIHFEMPDPDVDALSLAQEAVTSTRFGNRALGPH